MKNLKMGLVSLDQQSNHGIMDEENQDSSLGSDSSNEISSSFSSSSDSELLDEDENEEKGEGGEDFSEFTDSTSPNSSISHEGALQNMSTLLQELPFKRGLSKHYNGKSQSFTSLSNVRSLEDMAKPENPYNKKLKSCKSYGVFLEGFKSDNLQPPIRSSSSSRLSSKRGSCSSLRAKRNGSFLGNTSRPPVPPHRSTSTTSFTSETPPLFA